MTFQEFCERAAALLKLTGRKVIFKPIPAENIKL